MKANTIEEALNLFDPHRPLLEEDDIKAYYVARDNSPIGEMKTILKTASDFPKLLFSGPPGCGKYTELANLRESLKKDFHVIMFSIKDISNTYSLSLDSMLSYILKKIADKAKNEKLKIYNEKLEKIVSPPSIDVPGIGPSVPSKIDKGSETALDDQIFEDDDDEEEDDNLLKFMHKFTPRSSTKETIELINETVWDLEEKTKKDVLIIVPDMDKISLSHLSTMLTKFSLYLTKINCFAVYTFPSEFKHYLNFLDVYRNFTGVYFLPNFCISQRNGEADVNGRAKLKEIISKRLSPKLIYDEATDLIIQLSGGIVHELINLVRQCCIVALMEKITFIDDEVVRTAEERIRKVYNSVYDDEVRQVLFKVKQEKKSVEYDEFYKLIKQFSVIEYGLGDQLWYDINPILNPLIEGLETKETEII